MSAAISCSVLAVALKVRKLTWWSRAADVLIVGDGGLGTQGSECLAMSSPGIKNAARLPSPAKARISQISQKRSDTRAVALHIPYTAVTRPIKRDTVADIAEIRDVELARIDAFFEFLLGITMEGPSAN